MPCFHPLTGYRARTIGKNGKRPIVFSASEGFVDLPVQVPCGQCIGCRLERSRQWAVRCMHEASLHDANCFLTLTYAPENLPAFGSLVPADLQLFMKRLRKRIAPKRVSFFACGEYGENLDRPHYHVILFGFMFPDRERFKTLPSGEMMFRSAMLEDLWPFGFSSIGNVTFESAAYVARYTCKKVTGELADEHYLACDTSTGELQERVPEFARMSLRPAVGKLWFDRYSSEVLSADSVVVRGMEMKPPAYYDKLHAAVDAVAAEAVKLERMKANAAFKGDQTPERLRVREVVRTAKFNLFKRNLS